MLECVRLVVYAVACATRRKAQGIGGVSWYLPAYACLGMRGATILVCGAFRLHTSGVRRMSGHTCDRQRPGRAVDSVAFPAASEDMGASSPCPTTPTRRHNLVHGVIVHHLAPITPMRGRDVCEGDVPWVRLHSNGRVSHALVVPACRRRCPACLGSRLRYS